MWSRSSRLAPDEPAPAVVPIESLLEAAPEAEIEPTGGLEASFRTFDLMIRQRPGTMARRAVRVTPRSVSPAPHPPEPEEVAVAIGTLFYRGHAALQRANTVRHQINAALTRDASLESLQPLLQELLDLVPLALES